MTYKHILIALSLVFVIEGILPFMCPECWRKTMARIANQDDRSLRIFGLISMMIGVITIFLINHHLL